MKAKYNNAYYWQNLIHKQQLPQIFNNEPITEQSCFFHGIIYNAHGRRTMIEDILHFPEIDACIGYLRYIYLPMAFFSFTNQKNGIALPIDFSLAELIDYISDNDFIQYYQYRRPMDEVQQLIELLCRPDLTEELTKHFLVRIEQIFSEYFRRDTTAYAFFHLYSTPVALGTAFSQLYQIDNDKILGEKIFYSRTGLNKTQWQQLYSQADSNIFASRKLMNTLQNLRHS